MSGYTIYNNKLYLLLYFIFIKAKFFRWNSSNVCFLMVWRRSCILGEIVSDPRNEEKLA